MSIITINGGNRWYDQLGDIAKKAGRFEAHVGILSGATTVDGMSVAEYAFYNEYGTSRIPSRPFLRMTEAAQSEGWKHDLQTLLKNLGYDAPAALELVAQGAVADVVETIEQGVPPANAPSTIANKRRRGKTEPDHTLVDTGTLEHAIGYEVVDK